MLKYKGIDGVLLLQGSKLRDVEIAKEVAGALIFVVGIGGRDRKTSASLNISACRNFLKDRQKGDR